MSNRGGKRENAGRPRGQGKFGEPTVTMRIPESQTATIKDFLEALQRKRANAAGDNAVSEVDEFFIPEISDQPTLLPLFATKVAAGFPSPADDHVEKRLDVSEFLIDHAASTFFVTIKGDSMIDVGLLPGDKVVVDRSKTPVIGDIVLAVVVPEWVAIRLFILHYEIMTLEFLVCCAKTVGDAIPVGYVAERLVRVIRRDCLLA